MKGAAAAWISLALAAPLGAQAQSFSTSCGGAAFTIEVARAGGHPLDNTYRIAGAVAGGPSRTVFTSEDGGWLDAACVRDGRGRERLLFQASCGGSACVEDRYGLVDPQRLVLLLAPGPGDRGNAKAAAAALGLPEAPWLPESRDAFCCRAR